MKQARKTRKVRSHSQTDESGLTLRAWSDALFAYRVVVVGIVALRTSGNAAVFVDEHVI